jgi:diguanylate cyclase (GGDEF)-like protein
MLDPDVADSERATHRPGEPDVRWIRRTSGVLAVSLALLATVLGARLVAGDPGPLDWLAFALLLSVVVAAAVLWRRRALSRSVSPDAIVAAIAGELALGAEADHVAVVRRRDDPPRLEATLVAARAGVRDARTTLPIGDLVAPLDAPAGDAGSTWMAVPVDPDAPVPALVGEPPAGAPASNVGPAGRSSTGGSSAGWDPVPESPGAATSGAVPSQAHPLAAASAAAGGPPLRPVGVAEADRIADRIAARVRAVFGLRHVLAAPLVVDERVVGALVLSRRASPDWTPAARRLLADAATEASLALGRADSQRAAETRASTDALTGLPNRRYFDEFCGLLARRRRTGDAVGVLMIDIDHFKKLNDRLGHPVGDEVLRAVGGAIAATVRGEDIPARYGGEEFVVLLRNPSPEVAVDVAERIRASVRGIDLADLRGSRITVSVGAAVQVDPVEPIDQIVGRADRALYRAKKDGRDRVVAA